MRKRPRWPTSPSSPPAITLVDGAAVDAVAEAYAAAGRRRWEAIFLTLPGATGSLRHGG